MFGKRADGKQVKGLDSIGRLMPLFMKHREGAVNKFLLQIKAEPLDDFIKAQKDEGRDYTYRDILIATIVRGFKMFPRLNRFISANRIYQRNCIDVSMNVHKSLRTGAEEAVVKARFTGYETLDEVKQILDCEIKKSIEGNDSDDAAGFLTKLPLFLLKMAVGGLKLFDNLGLLSDKFLFSISPFHTSFYFADLKSIGMDYCYHHLYNFGNCGLFAAMGKEKLAPTVCDGKIVIEKIVEVGISEDERCVDGLYFSRALKALHRILRNPSCLLAPLNDNQILADAAQS